MNRDLRRNRACIRMSWPRLLRIIEYSSDRFPAASRIEDVAIDWFSETITLKLSSPEFKPVREGEEIPLFEIEAR